MMCYSTEHGARKYAKRFGFLSFARWKPWKPVNMEKY